MYYTICDEVEIQKCLLSILIIAIETNKVPVKDVTLIINVLSTRLDTLL